MKIKRSNYIVIEPENHYEKNKIIKLLETFCICVNPKYIQQQNKKFFNKEPKFIKTYRTKENRFAIHKGYQEVYQKLHEMALPLDKTDERVSFKTEIKCDTGPRDEEQKKAIDAISNNPFGYGILEATPSSGKTYISLKLASIFKERTLILVDMALLIDQFIDSILEFTNIKEEEIAIIRGSEATVTLKHKIIIATAQTLIKRKDLMQELSKTIGYLIVDEVHVASCNTFQNIIPFFKPKYQLGLSGTPNRDDEMEFLIKQSIGPIVYTADKQKMIDSGSMLVPILKPIFLKDDKNFNKYNLNEEVDFRDVVENYYLNPNAINKITKLVMYHYQKNDSQLLICKEFNVINAYYYKLLKVLCGEDIEVLAEKERMEKLNNLEEELRLAKRQLDLKRDATNRQLKMLENKKITEEELKEKLKKERKTQIGKIEKKIEKTINQKWVEFDVVKNHPKYNEVYVLTGKVGREERKRIIEEANAGKIKILIVSTVMDKAISINRINTEYLLFSTREVANTIQRIGRCIRSFPGKTKAIVYDIIYDHYMSFYQFINNSNKYRMKAHKIATAYNTTSMDLFIEFLRCRFRQTQMDAYKEKEFMEKYYKNFVVDIND